MSNEKLKQNEHEMRTHPDCQFYGVDIKAVLEEKDKQLSEREAVIAEREKEIANLKTELFEYKRGVKIVTAQGIEQGKEIAALKSKLGEAEKFLNEIENNLEPDPAFNEVEPNVGEALRIVRKALSSLRTPSDGEGK